MGWLLPALRLWAYGTLGLSVGWYLHAQIAALRLDRALDGLRQLHAAELGRYEANAGAVVQRVESDAAARIAHIEKDRAIAPAAQKQQRRLLAEYEAERQRLEALLEDLWRSLVEEITR